MCLIGSGPLGGSPDFSSEPLPVKEQNKGKGKYLKESLYEKGIENNLRFKEETQNWLEGEDEIDEKLKNMR